MSVTLDLPTEIENELLAEAARLGLPLREYILRLLSGMLKPNNKPRTGAELVEYWRSEGLIGTRSDIADSQTRAREIHGQGRTCFALNMFLEARHAPGVHRSYSSSQPVSCFLSAEASHSQDRGGFEDSTSAQGIGADRFGRVIPECPVSIAASSCTLRCLTATPRSKRDLPHSKR